MRFNSGIIYTNCRVIFLRIFLLSKEKVLVILNIIADGGIKNNRPPQVSWEKLVAYQLRTFSKDAFFFCSHHMMRVSYSDLVSHSSSMGRLPVWNLPRLLRTREKAKYQRLEGICKLRENQVVWRITPPTSPQPLSGYREWVTCR